MTTLTMLVIGGGVAGLSAASYGAMNGFRPQLIEHGREPGGVCTAWKRGDYTIDGCIHWLLGSGPDGPFRPMLEELRVVPAVRLEPIELFTRYEDPVDGWSVDVTNNMDRLRRDLLRLAPEDRRTIDRIFAGVDAMADFQWPVDRPVERVPLAERLAQLWAMRRTAPTFARFEGNLGSLCQRHVRSPRLRALLRALVAEEMPAFFLLMLLSQLEAGQLTRPIGGSGVFRDALVRRYVDLGGELELETTVEEILAEDGRAVGVRLTDGTMRFADVLVSTASAHETAQHLLGGRFLDRSTRKRLDHWPTFEALTLVSLGVERTFADTPWSLIVRQAEPFALHGRAQPQLAIRIYENEDQTFAPEGHAVVQSMLETDYRYWASRGDMYPAARDAAAMALLERLETRFPGLRDDVRMIDVATPLTYWRFARVWRGAFEGWLPTHHTWARHLPRTMPGLEGLYLAGQWVEPGGGIPVSLVSGRHAVQVICEDLGKPFRTT